MLAPPLVGPGGKNSTLASKSKGMVMVLAESVALDFCLGLSCLFLKPDLCVKCCFHDFGGFKMGASPSLEIHCFCRSTLNGSTVRFNRYILSTCTNSNLEKNTNFDDTVIWNYLCYR